MNRQSARECRALVDRLAAHGVLVRSLDGELELYSPVAWGVSAELREEAKGMRVELREFVEWRGAAREMVAAWWARLEALVPVGASLDSPEWKQRDCAIHDAYWSFDLTALARALDDFESALRATVLHRQAPPMTLGCRAWRPAGLTATEHSQ